MVSACCFIRGFKAGNSCSTRSVAASMAARSLPRIWAPIIRLSRTRHLGNDDAALRHIGDAAMDPPVGGLARDVGAIGRDAALPGAQQAGRDLDRGGFAGAVGADDGRDHAVRGKSCWRGGSRRRRRNPTSHPEARAAQRRPVMPASALVPGRDRQFRLGGLVFLRPDHLALAVLDLHEKPADADLHVGRRGRPHACP